jgi:hypothetical protein
MRRDQLAAGDCTLRHVDGDMRPATTVLTKGGESMTLAIGWPHEHDQADGLDLIDLEVDGRAETSYDFVEVVASMPDSSVVRLGVYLGLLGLYGCGVSAPGACQANPIVTVTDGATGQLLCGATVIANPSSDFDGSAPFEADVTPPCTYGDPSFGYLGPFTITASQDGFQTTSVSNVRVAYAAPCATPVSPQRINITLQPN